MCACAARFSVAATDAAARQVAVARHTVSLNVITELKTALRAVATLKGGFKGVQSAGGSGALAPALVSRSALSESGGAEALASALKV